MEAHGSEQRGRVTQGLVRVSRLVARLHRLRCLHDHLIPNRRSLQALLARQLQNQRRGQSSEAGRVQVVQHVLLSGREFTNSDKRNSNKHKRKSVCE